MAITKAELKHLALMTVQKLDLSKTADVKQIPMVYEALEKAFDAGQKSTVKLLTKDEHASIQKFAEDVWVALEENELGGYSGINRPFYLIWMFKKVIEKYGDRNIGLTLTADEVDAIKKAGA